MKHNLKITIILISMFVITQLIGLFIINTYISHDLPYGLEPPTEMQPVKSCTYSGDALSYIWCLITILPGTIILSFLIAIGLFFILTKVNADTFIRFWFFIVTILAIALSVNAIFFRASIIYPALFAIIVAIPLAYFKIFKRNIMVHNITELLIYPGIATVFIPIVGVLGIVVLLLIISLYDIWAVWQSRFMQKMANYQIKNLRIFTGFFIPYADKKEKDKIKHIKEKYINKSEKFLEKKFKEANIKVHLAILGGGDIVFPIVTAGIFYKAYGSIFPALLIVLFAALGLLYLFLFAKKGKFYPAMPFLTIAMYIGMILSWALMAVHII